ncbi:dUTP diphosphatase [Entomobacter blattae]|uniref:Deoxyuridine 5'-triphosphate nucleotidohydrolase n=1 Tax=Entomobacter blattae TaxID=2762277 RepID=A0A7H1NT43_9PROT|nr:dUTP diphosphatase [Entomobacter blattae]QNT78953.1 Deoxyuridine 5'-triphosphate nucleotidohydrolase [Entomobacter blattae]
MSTDIKVKVFQMAHARDLPLPQYETSGAAGFDFPAAIEDELVILPFGRALIPTGLQIALPEGYELQIRPRSGLALKNGITLPNSPGTIDEDYRGEIKVILMNCSDDPFIITRGMRIAQGVLAPVVRLSWEKVEGLEETVRSEKGFGSTGH